MGISLCGHEASPRVFHLARAQAAGRRQFRLAADVGVEKRRARNGGAGRLSRPILRPRRAEDRRRVSRLSRHLRASGRPTLPRLPRPPRGATFRHTLDRALASGSPIVQIATWNDFGEGTCVEPTRERGDRDLLTLQHARRKLSGSSFPYQPADLHLPLRIYTHRKRFGSTSPQHKALDEVADLISAGECAAPRVGSMSWSGVVERSRVALHLTSSPHCRQARLRN